MFIEPFMWFNLPMYLYINIFIYFFLILQSAKSRAFGSLPSCDLEKNPAALLNLARCVFQRSSWMSVRKLQKLQPLSLNSNGEHELH